MHLSGEVERSHISVIIESYVHEKKEVANLGLVCIA